LFGERSLTTVAALFGRPRDARDAAQEVVRDARLPEAQVRVVGPGDTTVDHKLEPEDRGIARTLVKSHVTLGIAGWVVGSTAGALLILAGVGWAVASPLFTLGLAAAFGAIGGLMLGGLVSMRPDRALVDTAVKSAVQRGSWAVIVHPVKQGEEARALEVLQRSGGEVVRTL
jgi:uncharacterized membrane protein